MTDGFARVAAIVPALMAEHHVPGVSIGVLQDGAERYASFGVTSVEHGLQVDEDTIFQIGSTTKTVTATVALRLMERGALDLDAPVRRYLPALRLADADVLARVTLRHLLTHTFGLEGDYFDLEDCGYGDDALARAVGKLEALPQTTPLGGPWSYCNSGFFVAGRVIEAIARMPYERVVSEEVFKPLGMERSFFFAHQAMTHRFAVGHVVVDERPVVARPWPLARAANPAGGIASTARDQLRYARFHLGDGTAPGGERLLRRETLEGMRRPLVETHPRGERMGLTWFTRERDGVTVVRHGGATNGQLSAFLFVPERRFAVTVLTNANRGGLLHAAVTRAALREFLGLADPEPARADPPADRLREYAGRYVSTLSDVELRMEEGALVLAMTNRGLPDVETKPPSPPPARVVFVGEDEILVPDGLLKDSRGDFLRDERGQIRYLRFGGRARRRVDRVER